MRLDDPPVSLDLDAATGYLPADAPQRAMRETFVEISRDLLTLALDIDGTEYSFFTYVLRSTAAKRPLNDLTLSFFALYERLEAQLGFLPTYRQARMKDAITRLAAQHDNGPAAFRTYQRPNYPDDTVLLPLYVRNVIAHGGTSLLNALSVEDLHAAGRLLSKWASTTPDEPPNNQPVVRNPPADTL